MAVAKTDLKFYLTGAEPLVTQTNLAQSLGAYPSLTEVNLSTSLYALLSSSATSLQTTNSLTANSAVAVDAEMIEVTGSTTGASSPFTLSGLTRGSYNTVAKPHCAGVPVYNIGNSIFNKSFNDDGSQYRCIAVTNVNASSAFYDLKFYVKTPSANPNSTIQFAVERPRTEQIIGTATAGSTISLVDSSLIGAFDDEHDGCVLQITSGLNIGVGRKIAAFDTKTGTFTFLQSFPYAIAAGTHYRVEVGPSQRITSGTISPVFGTSSCSSLSSANNMGSAVSINVGGGRANTVNLMPYETVYLWLSRNLGVNPEQFDNNRVFISANYKVS